MKLNPPTPAQRRAADPRHSVWVTANAGTGKTRVLSDRVLRLLLSGAPPEGILCITFTKAAAAEMSHRIEARLAQWAVGRDEDHLAADLYELTGERPRPATLTKARRLFADVLDLPHGLNIMTIHSLCQALLKRFPLEAGVAPHFQTIDGRSAQELMAEARAEVLGELCRQDRELGKALDILAVTLAESTLTGAIGEMLGARHRLMALARAHHADGRIDGLLASIDALLEVEAGLEPVHLIERACADGVCDVEALRQAASLMAAKGTEAVKERGLRILGWLNGTPGQRAGIFEIYRALFVTADGKARQSLVTKALQADCLPALANEQARLVRLGDSQAALILSRRTRALLRLGHAVIGAYEAQKSRSAFLDFDDLIEHTRRLLSDPGRAGWVLFKLDERLAHMLVDEAQDTSPAQWDIVERLTEEFRAGLGASEATRTLFVVGDEKQSIYSFQGARIAHFREMRRKLTGFARESGQVFSQESLDLSFRSSRAVLDLVDAMLTHPEMRGGVVFEGESVRHDTNRRNALGTVELWPLAEHAGEEAETTPWPLPDAPRTSDEPERRVAKAIAERIDGWLRSGELLASEGRPIHPGDVLILLNRRGRIQELVIRALKRAGVPVAGADRMLLGEHIAVKDLIALGRAILLPEDDLTLATVLKSPLLGLDEEQLFTLAWDREQHSLLERLRERSGDPAFAPAYERLSGWMRQADFMPPFEFYCAVLGQKDRDGHTGRWRMLQRLGPDAAEPIEAFLSQALSYENGHPASLEGFLHWLSLDEQQLKRDPESTRDAVRVMTVHGAKGLEAPIVFLADAGPHRPASPGRILWLERHGGLPVWRMPDKERDPRCQDAADTERRLQREESQRLLYVALTRARDRLYVTGWSPKRGGTEGSPHELLCRVLAGIDGVERFDASLGRHYKGEALRLTRGVAAERQAGLNEPEPAILPLEPWATTPVAAEPAALLPLQPSRLADVEPTPEPAGGPAARQRMRRGLLAHRLLQLLPGLEASAREAAGARVLHQLAPDLPEPERADLLRQVQAVLTMPDLAPAFAPGSRAEQPLCGEVNGVLISGQVDRLARHGQTVTLVDYKTGRTPPGSAEATPLVYLRQMAAYRALLQAIYPGHEVRAGLVWTEGPRLDLLPSALLDRHAPGRQ